MPEFRTEKDATVEHISKPLEIMKPHRIYEYEDKIILIAYVGKGEDTFTSMTRPREIRFSPESSSEMAPAK